MKSVLVALKEYNKQASVTEKGIIKFILNHPEKAIELSIYELAQETYASPSTIIRMCKKNKFSGFKDLKKNLIFEVAVRKESVKQLDKEIVEKDSIENIVDIITQRNIISLEETKKLISLSTMKQCVKFISNCKSISFFGIGSSLIVARDAQQKFMRIKRQCFVYDDWHLQLLQAKNMTPEDIGIIISYSGETEEMIKCAKEIKMSGAKLISITRYGESTITKITDHNLYVAANESTFRSGAMSSRISQLNIIDILYTACANQNYEESLERIRKTHFKKG